MRASRVSSFCPQTFKRQSAHSNASLSFPAFMVGIILLLIILRLCYLFAQIYFLRKGIYSISLMSTKPVHILKKVSRLGTYAISSAAIRFITYTDHQVVELSGRKTVSPAGYALSVRRPNTKNIPVTHARRLSRACDGYGAPEGSYC